MEHREWTTIDKSSWGEGPWQTEPDKVQWTDETTSLPCLIHRTKNSGALCGYVGIATGHPLFEYGDYPSVDVHGGCTFFDFCQPDHAEDGSSGICHIPGPGESDRVKWVGFDCAHFNDLVPASAPFSNISRNQVIYRTLTFVRSEIESLAKQLKAMEAAAPETTEPETI